MIFTEFLPVSEYKQFGYWLESQDDETRQLYFGMASNQYLIDSIMKKVLDTPENHYFLIAKDGTKWVGSIHIAVSGNIVEFGVIVSKDYRNHGVGGKMLEEAIIWSRNRGFQELYMHCLGWNKPIQHLCRKHGLETKNMHGDTEVELKLQPANWVTINKEICIKQRNLYHKFLQDSQILYHEICKI